MLTGHITSGSEALKFGPFFVSKKKIGQKMKHKSDKIITYSTWQNELTLFSGLWIPAASR